MSSQLGLEDTEIVLGESKLIMSSLKAEVRDRSAIFILPNPITKFHFSSPSTSQQYLTQVNTSFFSSPLLQLLLPQHTPLVFLLAHWLLLPSLFGWLLSHFSVHPGLTSPFFPLIWPPSLPRIVGSHGSKYHLYMDDV